MCFRRKYRDNPDMEKDGGKIKSQDGKNLNTWLILASCLMIAILLFVGINRASAAAAEAYRLTYETEEETAYQLLYDHYFDSAEQNYHVSNQVTITVGALRETAKLEVLRVYDVEYIIEDNNENGITSWLEVPGSGTYIVDLQTAEFITDDERGYVRIRVPYPEITNISIDYANVKKLFFKNDLFNDSYKIGEDLARKQLNSADMLIKKEFASNQNFYLNAQEAAISTIQCLVKSLNPEIPDLEVQVEFY